MSEFSAQLRLPSQIKKGEVIEAKLKIQHESKTGLQLNEDAKTAFERFTRAEPAAYVKTVEVFYGDEQVSVFELNSSTSDDPLLAFKLRADREGTVRVVMTDHARKTVEVKGDIQFSG
jgi:hypothetical protein